MKINIRGENIEVTEAIRNYAEEKVKKIEKFLNDADTREANIVIKVYNKIQIVEITVPLKNIILRAEVGEEDIYAAIDVAVDKLERQVRKNKTKIAALSKKKKLAEELRYEYFEKMNEKEDDEKEHRVVKRKSIDVKPMSEEEAMLQMDLLGHEFFLYKDADTMKPAVIYKRKDGNFGLIEAE